MGRFIFILCFLGLLNFYVALRLVTFSPYAGEHVVTVFSLMAVFMVLQMASPFGERLLPPAFKKLTLLSWISYLSFGILSLLVFYAFITDLLRIVVGIFYMPEDQARFDYYSMLVWGGATLLTSLIGFWQATSGPIVRKIDVSLKNLPAGFDGFTIAQISDLHVGPTIKKSYAEKVVEQVNGLKPDLIALTGDFIDGKVEDLAGDIAPIARLRAPNGVYYITGNHEYYWGALEWMNHFKTLGAHVLANSHDIVRKGNDAIIVAGVTDYSTIHMGASVACNPAKSIEGAPGGLVKILLAHQPVTYKMAEKAGFNLQLSGHTHAGQYFPFSVLIRFFQKFYKGLNRYKDLLIYVNSGTGYWGPPLRTGAPAEITLLTLRR